MLTALVLAIRIAANPVSNVFQKQLVQRSADPVFVIAATHGWLTLVSLPLLLGAVAAHRLSRGMVTSQLCRSAALAVTLESIDDEASQSFNCCLFSCRADSRLGYRRLLLDCRPRLGAGRGADEPQRHFPDYCY